VNVFIQASVYNYFCTWLFTRVNTDITYNMVSFSGFFFKFVRLRTVVHSLFLRDTSRISYSSSISLVLLIPLLMFVTMSARIGRNNRRINCLCIMFLFLKLLATNNLDMSIWSFMINIVRNLLKTRKDFEKKRRSLNLGILDL
jgi:hypothetical protein